MPKKKTDKTLSSIKKKKKIGSEVYKVLWDSFRMLRTNLRRERPSNQSKRENVCVHVTRVLAPILIYLAPRFSYVEKAQLTSTEM